MKLSEKNVRRLKEVGEFFAGLFIWIFIMLIIIWFCFKYGPTARRRRLQLSDTAAEKGHNDQKRFLKEVINFGKLEKLCRRRANSELYHKKGNESRKQAREVKNEEVYNALESLIRELESFSRGTVVKLVDKKREDVMTAKEKTKVAKNFSLEYEDQASELMRKDSNRDIIDRTCELHYTLSRYTLQFENVPLATTIHENTSSPVTNKPSQGIQRNKKHAKALKSAQSLTQMQPGNTTTAGNFTNIEPKQLSLTEVAGPFWSIFILGTIFLLGFAIITLPIAIVNWVLRSTELRKISQEPSERKPLVQKADYEHNVVMV